MCWLLKHIFIFLAPKLGLWAPYPCWVSAVQTSVIHENVLHPQTHTCIDWPYQEMKYKAKPSSAFFDAQYSLTCISNSPVHALQEWLSHSLWRAASLNKKANFQRKDLFWFFFWFLLWRPSVHNTEALFKVYFLVKGSCLARGIWSLLPVLMNFLRP